jgi:hypothetical protein
MLRTLAMLLLMLPAAAQLHVIHLPARDATYREGDLATVTLRLENPGTHAVALLAAESPSPVSRPLSFLEPMAARLVPAADGDGLELDQSEDDEQPVLVGGGILRPGERLVFALTVRLGAVSRPDELLSVPIQISGLVLRPDGDGWLPVLLPAWETRRDQNTVFRPATLESVDGLARLPVPGRRFLLRPGADGERIVGTGEARLQVSRDPARPGGADVPRFRDRRLGIWIEATAGMHGHPGLPQGHSAPAGWSFAALLVRDWWRSRSLTVRFADVEAAAPFADLQLWAPDRVEMELQLPIEQLEDLQRIVADHGLQVQGVLRHPWSLLIRRSPGR